MIKEFVEKWDKNKGKLKEEIEKNVKKGLVYSSYEEIVIELFKKIINSNNEKYDINNIDIIDNGNYSGSQIFILHKSKYSPDVSEYIYTYVYYGSCSTCDTLKSIYWDYEQGEISENETVSELMTIALHLLQRCKRFEEFVEIEGGSK